MRHPPPEIEKRRRVESHGAEPSQKTDCHKSANVQPDTTERATAWAIPPDSHDGLEIFIGGKGHIVLTQHQPFMDKAEIVLHSTEAQALQELLPAAIVAANEHRRPL